MNKCTQCGTEHDGKFCPECGTPVAREKTEEGKPAAPRLREAQTSVDGAYRILTLFPAALLAFFGVLMLVLFATPVLKNAFGESASNLYGKDYLNDIPSLGGVRSAMLAFGILSLIAGIAVSVLRFVPQLRYNCVTVRGKTFFWHEAAIIALPLYLIMAILAGIAKSKISSADSGFGFIKAGACTYLVLVFSLLFLIGAIGVYAAMFLLAKKGANADENALKEEITARRAADKEKALAALSDPAMLEKMRNTRKPVQARAQSALRLKRCGVLPVIILAIGNSVCSVLAIINDFPLMPTFLLKVYLLFIGASILFAALFLLAPVRVSYTKIRRFKGNGGIFWAAFFLFDNCCMITTSIVNGNVDIPYAIPFVMHGVAIAASIANLIAHVAAKKCFRTLRMEVFGTDKPAKDATPLHEEDKNALADYKECRRNIRLYKKYKAGTEKMPAERCASTVAIATIGALILLVSAFFAIYIPVDTQPYSASYVRKIALHPDFDNDFKQYFGAPTIVSKDTYEWYSGKYGSYKKQLTEKYEALENALRAENEKLADRLDAEIDELKEKMQGMRYKYLCITVSDYTIQTIELDVKRQSGSDFEDDETPTQKRIKKTRTHKSGGVEIFYTDGSYSYSRAATEAPEIPEDFDLDDLFA